VNPKRGTFSCLTEGSRWGWEGKKRCFRQVQVQSLLYIPSVACTGRTRPDGRRCELGSCIYWADWTATNQAILTYQKLYSCPAVLTDTTLTVENRRLHSLTSRLCSRPSTHNILGKVGESGEDFCHLNGSKFSCSESLESCTSRKTKGFDKVARFLQSQSGSLLRIVQGHMRRGASSEK